MQVSEPAGSSKPILQADTRIEPINDLHTCPPPIQKYASIKQNADLSARFLFNRQKRQTTGARRLVFRMQTSGGCRRNRLSYKRWRCKRSFFYQRTYSSIKTGVTDVPFWKSFREHTPLTAGVEHTEDDTKNFLILFHSLSTSPSRHA